MNYPCYIIFYTPNDYIHSQIYISPALCSSQLISQFNHIFIIFTIMILIFMALGVLCAGLNIEATPNIYTINTQTNYIWDISFDTTQTRDLLVLHFPSDVQFSANTSVLDLNNASAIVDIDAINNNELRLNLTSASLEDTADLSLKVTDVLNPPYVYEGQIGYTSDVERTVVKETPPSTVDYTPGLINNCEISFDGFTDEALSTAYFQFQVSNAINEGSPATLIFTIKYDDYLSSTKSIVSNADPQCQLDINGDGYSGIVTSTVDVNVPHFICTFSSSALSQDDNVTLRLTSIQNPFTSTNYFPLLEITTSNNKYQFDSTDSCTFNSVDVVSYSAEFSDSLQVNAPYTSASLLTDSSISTRIQEGESVVMVFEDSLVGMSGCSGEIVLQRGGADSVTFTGGSDSPPSGTQFTGEANDDNLNTGEITLYIKDCTITMPPSATPSPFTFTFQSSSNAFLQITAELQATVSALPSSNVDLVLTNDEIGGESDYEFVITVGHGLSSNPTIVINLPLDIDVSTIGNCSVLIGNDAATGESCAVIDSINKIIEVNFTHQSSISTNETISITLSSLMNPNDPDSYSAFNLITYYSAADSSSMVESGNNLFTQAYGARTTIPTLQNNTYIVSQQNAPLVLVYTSEVNLPSNTRLIVSFSGDVSDVIYRYLQLDGVDKSPTNSSSSQTFTINYPDATNKGAVFRVGFELNAPAHVGVFEVVELMVTDSSGTVYEQTSTALTLEVTTPAQQSFTITPTSQVAGDTTSYQFYFYSNVPHTLPFILRVEFPSDVVLDASNSACTGDCEGAFVDRSSGGVQTIDITVNNSSSNSYEVTISSVINPNVVGQTGVFQLTTLTTTSDEIVWGVATASIEDTNTLTATLDESKYYYRGNTDDIFLNIQVTNQLSSGDYFFITFTDQDYSIDSNLSCLHDDICQVYNSTSSVTVVKIQPNDTKVSSLSMDFIISGMISSSNTVYQQEIDVEVSSFSSGDNAKDSGYFTYKIDCGDNSTIRSLNCKTCANQVCITCYTENNYYLYGSECTNNCGNSSQYQTFPNSSVCETCIDPCHECYSATECKSCDSGYVLYQNYTCSLTCTLSDGYYNQTFDGQEYCLPCWDVDCVDCSDGGSTSCLLCNNETYLVDGRCENSCGSTHMFEVNGICEQCDDTCDTCEGTSTNCTACSSGYYNVSGACLDECPNGTVVVGSTCGCDSACGSCYGISSNCTSCASSSDFLYSGECLDECPASTYNSSSQCVDCSTGCLECVRTGCSQCLTGYDVYDGGCYSDCNSLGDRYSSFEGFCVKCPTGCDVCDDASACSLCLDGYTLVDSVCYEDCEIDNTCEVETDDTITPLPAAITAVVWIVIVVVLKLTAVGVMYVPYSYLFLGSVFQVVLVLVIVVIQNTAINEGTSTRLLQTVIQQYQYTVVGLLAASIALSYLSNFLYVCIFWKYLRPLIPDRQIDTISNYIVLGFGVLINYRICLIAFAKFLPKPSIPISHPNQLTPVHYLIALSIMLTILPVAAAAILISNESALSDLFMISIDFLIIAIVNVICSIWMIAKAKPEDYFQSTKKYQLEENYRTDQELKSEEKKNQKNISKIGLVANETDQVSDIDFMNLETIENKKELVNKKAHKSDNENQPLPVIPIRASNVTFQQIRLPNKEADEISQPSIAKTRVKKNKTKKYIDKSEEPQNNQQSNKDEQLRVESKKKEEAKNYGKQISKKIYENEDKESEVKIQEDIEEIVFDNEPTMKQTNSAILGKKDKHGKSQRMSALGPMVKKKTHPMFESEAVQSDIDEIDLEAIIKSKMIDLTKTKKPKETKTEVDKEEQHMNEEISPSWFNIQNQRFDVDENDSQ